MSDPRPRAFAPGQVYRNPANGELVVVLEVQADGYVHVAPMVPAESSTNLVGPRASTDAVLTTATERCSHEGARWDPQNRYLECRACGEQVKSGVCMRCGRPAGGERDGVVYSTEGFACARCFRG